MPGARTMRPTAGLASALVRLALVLTAAVPGGYGGGGGEGGDAGGGGKYGGEGGGEGGGGGRGGGEGGGAEQFETVVNVLKLLARKTWTPVRVVAQVRDTRKVLLQFVEFTSQKKCFLLWHGFKFT